MNRSQYAAAFARLSKAHNRYAECVKITRDDGTVYRFSAHDRDLLVTELDGARYTYSPAGAFKLTALEMQSGLAVTNMDIDALITDDTITEQDLRNGLFAGAQFDLFIAFWTNSRVQTLPLRSSWVGDLLIKDMEFKADLRGIAQRLAQVFVDTTSLECRYDFGDSDCQVSLAPLTDTHYVRTVVSQDEVILGEDVSDNIMQWGSLLWSSGNNNGLAMEIIHHHGSRIKLFLPMDYKIEEGDNLIITQGCDKTYDACVGYGNLVRFGGEPFLAGSDVITRYPDVRS